MITSYLSGIKILAIQSTIAARIAGLNRTLVLAFLFLLLCSLNGSAQIRFKSLDDESPVTVRTPTRIKAPVKAPSAPARPKYNWLILRTYPADAEIRINDKVE